jgi:hypothetical protein
MGIHYIHFRNNRRHLRLLPRCGRGQAAHRQLVVCFCCRRFMTVSLTFMNHDAQGRTPWPYVTVRRLTNTAIFLKSSDLKINKHIIWLTYLLTHSMEQSPSWEASRFSASKKFPAFYGTRRFITAFTRTRHLSLSSASSISPYTHIPIPQKGSCRISIVCWAWLLGYTSSPHWNPPRPDPTPTARYAASTNPWTETI